jgi:hypothetical protein
MPPAKTFARGYLRFRPVALTAPALPEPTASTKQEHNHDDNQNRFEAHIEVLRREFRRSRFEQSVQKGTRAASSHTGAGETVKRPLSQMQENDARHCALWQTRYRSPSWEIYTHLQGPSCFEKTVSGWTAVELAIDMRATNVPTPREANAVSIGGVGFRFVSLVDDDHCHAEMNTLTISQRDFLPAALHSENADAELRPDLYCVADAMGHEDLKTTRIYQHPELSVIRDAIDERNRRVM